MEPRKLDIAFLGYTRELSIKGLRQFAENNKEQVLKFKSNSCESELYLTDGTRIIAIGYSENWQRRYKFDQLILFDDDRWLIETNKREEINNIRHRTMYISNVPEEFQILLYEDVREYQYPTTISFENGSTITAFNSDNTIRSKPRYFELFNMSNLYWWQQLYLRILDTGLIKWFYRFKRR